MNHSDGLEFAKTGGISTQTLQLVQGEIAYVFAVAAILRPGATIQSGYGQYESSGQYVSSLIIDIDGLDSNQTVGSWSSTTNVSLSTPPIVGPASIKIQLRPWLGRSGNGSNWSHSNSGSWDFKASEGYVTFRITGAQQEASKKFATVIPENSSGNVDIILEQSTDLINWSAVNPGSFPPSTAKRFFRVRSQE
jgi:type IV secretory pathway VirB2 component (pilin)